MLYNNVRALRRVLRQCALKQRGNHKKNTESDIVWVDKIINKQINIKYMRVSVAYLQSDSLLTDSRSN